MKAIRKRVLKKHLAHLKCLQKAYRCNLYVWWKELQNVSVTSKYFPT